MCFDHGRRTNGEVCDTFDTMTGVGKIFDSFFSRRFLAFTLNNVLVRLYHQGIHIKESQWVEVYQSRPMLIYNLPTKAINKQLKRVALIAQQKKESLVLLPCHKSHIDYLVISYIFFRLGEHHLEPWDCVVIAY